MRDGREDLRHWGLLARFSLVTACWVPHLSATLDHLIPHRAHVLSVARCVDSLSGLLLLLYIPARLRYAVVAILAGGRWSCGGSTHSSLSRCNAGEYLD
jgi:hypothetical protein